MRKRQKEREKIMERYDTRKKITEKDYYRERMVKRGREGDLNREIEMWKEK